MSLAGFVQSLLEDGAARVPLIASTEPFGGDPSGPERVPEADRAGVIAILSRYEPIVRAGWPMDAPSLDMGSAVQAAGFLYQAARFVLSRHAPAEVLLHVLGDDGVTACSPSSHYSVDLTGRFLPDLFRLAGGRLNDDPLLDCLRSFGSRWPLSSVGVPGVCPDAGRLDVLLDEPSLRAAYIDRVLELGDAERIADPRVAAAAGLVVGEHPGLIDAALQTALQDQCATSSSPSNKEM